MKIEEERICFNCNYFFPYPADEPTEEGICLKDLVFDPYMDELLENLNFNCCLDLVKEKKFNGNDNVCAEFEMIEILNGSEEFDNSFEEGQQNIMDQTIDDFLKNKGIGEYRNKLNANDRAVQIESLKGLSCLIAFGNEAAIELLQDYFRKIPAPVTLEDAQHKKEAMRFLKSLEMNDEILLHLIKDLKETESNNKTRQWISEILNILHDNRDNEIVQRYLFELLDEKHFSYKMRNKIKEILYM